MESRVKTLGFAFAMALCTVLAAGPGYAQEGAPPAGSDRDPPRGDGAGGSGSIGSGADSKGGAPAGGLNTPPGNPGGTLDRGGAPVRLEEGFSGLQRRANRKALIANAPKAPAGIVTNAGINAPFRRTGADGGARNAVGMAVPGGQGRTPPEIGTHAGAGVTGVAAPHVGAIGVAAPVGHVGDLRRPTVPPSPAMVPPPHVTGINGSTMGHIASGPGSVGGPAKDRAVINGTSIRPKH